MNSVPFPFSGAVEKLRGLVHSTIDDNDGAANDRSVNLSVSLLVMADTERNITKFVFQREKPTVSLIGASWWLSMMSLEVSKRGAAMLMMLMSPAVMMSKRARIQLQPI